MTRFAYLEDGKNGDGTVVNVDRIESISTLRPGGSVIQFAGDDHVIQLPDSSVLNTLKELGMVAG